MALELGKYGIRVNAICPGATPFDDGSGIDHSVEKIPMGRFGKPIDQGNAAVFLASNDASWITGDLFVIDGGQSLSF